jgi:MFS superfamily sulfate permease-like transporter
MSEATKTRAGGKGHFGGIARYVPILSWFPSYDRKWLGPDAIAGLTLWGLVAPEAIEVAG